jgi:hypothetical protein
LKFKNYIGIRTFSSLSADRQAGQEEWIFASKEQKVEVVVKRYNKKAPSVSEIRFQFSNPNHVPLMPLIREEGNYSYHKLTRCFAGSRNL